MRSRAWLSAYHSKVKQQLQDNQCVDACAKVVHHNSSSFRQSLQGTHWRRFNNIECTEKYKAGEQRWPHNGTSHQRQQLPGDFVNHHMRGIFLAASTLFQGRGGYANRDY